MGADQHHKPPSVAPPRIVSRPFGAREACRENLRPRDNLRLGGAGATRGASVGARPFVARLQLEGDAHEARPVGAESAVRPESTPSDAASPADVATAAPNPSDTTGSPAESGETVTWLGDTAVLAGPDDGGAEHEPWDRERVLRLAFLLEDVARRIRGGEIAVECGPDVSEEDVVQAVRSALERRRR